MEDCSCCCWTADMHSLCRHGVNSHTYSTYHNTNTVYCFHLGTAVSVLLMAVFLERKEDHVKSGERAENVTRDRQRDIQGTEEDGREIECDRKGEGWRVQLVAETERDVRIWHLLSLCWPSLAFPRTYMTALSHPFTLSLFISKEGTSGQRAREADREKEI